MLAYQIKLQSGKVFNILLEANQSCELTIDNNLAATFIYNDEKIIQETFKAHGFPDKISSVKKLSFKNYKEGDIHFFEQHCITYPNGVTICTRGAKFFEIEGDERV